MAAPDGPGRDQAHVREPKALRECVERLEAEGSVRRELDRRLVDQARARAVQSIGEVVDYLAERGLIDKADLRKHAEANFRLADAVRAAAMTGAAIDVYGWPIPAEAGHFLRCPLHVPDETIMVQGWEPRDPARSHRRCPAAGADAP